MSMMNEQDPLPAVTRAAQIILGALVMGAASFLVIVAFVLPAVGAGGLAVGKGPVVIGLPLLTLLAIVFGVVALAASYLVPALITSSQVREIAKNTTPDVPVQKASNSPPSPMATDRGRMLGLFQTQLIIASAINEGAAFFAGIVYMLEGHPAALVAALILIFVMASRFPTVDSVSRWVEERLRELQTARQDVL